MLIETENSSYKQLMSNLICCNSCRKIGSHIVYVLLSKILIISFWRKPAYNCKRNSHGSSKYQLPQSAADLSHYISHNAKCTSKLLKLLYNRIVDTEIVVLKCFAHGLKPYFGYHSLGNPMDWVTSQVSQNTPFSLTITLPILSEQWHYLAYLMFLY